MILKSIFLLLAITYASADFGSFDFPECSKPNQPVYGGDPCQVCVCTHQLQVNCTIRSSCLKSNFADVPLVKTSDNVLPTKDAKETKTKTENVTPGTTKPPCVLGTFYRKYCNTCKCFANGPGCTQKFCHNNIYNFDGTLVKSKSHKEEFDIFTNLNLNEDKDNGYFNYDHIGANNNNLNIVPISGKKIGNPVFGSTKTTDRLNLPPTMQAVEDF
ncbi:uncharacterized protein LOC122856965 [Aphidius gifuensis]|nr:uncharacterized protein LOC122856965 [Aphidius gifuensis]